MYFKSLTYHNVGPLRRIDFELPFNDEGFPKPLFVIGKNGSGKSVFVSNIVDALIEAAATRFGNVMPDLGLSGKQYFKVIRPSEISVGKATLRSMLCLAMATSICSRQGRRSLLLYAIRYT